MAAPAGEYPPAYAPGYPPQQPPQQSPYPPGYGDGKVDSAYPPNPQPGYPGMPPPGMPPPGGVQYGQQPYGQQPYGQPAGPGYPPGQQQGSTVVVGMPTVMVVSGFQEMPINITCPQCRQPVTTKTQYETGTLTWLICGALLLFGCWLGCCLIPLCVNGCKDVRHTCPNCNASVGVYRRI